MTDEEYLSRLFSSGEFVARARRVFPGITAPQARVLQLLLSREYLSIEGILTKEEISPKHLHNIIHFVRKRTQAQIFNSYGQGYYMRLEDRKRLNQEINNVHLSAY